MFWLGLGVGLLIAGVVFAIGIYRFSKGVRW
jgi:hypothetical protein